ncbi:ankyrin 2,3/unc44, partial [Thraustotheca clavata]
NADTLLHLAVRAQNDVTIDLLLCSDGINTNAYNKAPDSDIVVDFKSSVGAGGFGCVYKGTYKNEEVAVKTAHKDCENVLRKEISTMTKYQSPYIVNVVAVSNQPSSSPKLALQYMDCGDLRQYLNAKRDGYTTSINVTPLETDKQLLHASKSSQVHEVKRLLQEGANVNYYDNDGETPLHAAASKGRCAVATILLKAGALIDAQTNTGATPLHKATYGGHDSMIELLLQAGASVDLKNISGWTSLHLAADKGRVSSLQLLMNAGASVDTITNTGSLPLHYAAEKGHHDALNLLLKSSTSIDLENEYSRTPLHYAAWGGHKQVVTLLVEAGASINPSDKDGWTPLHLAASKGLDQVVKLLVASGASMNSKDKNGQTPKQIALKYGKNSSATLLNLLSNQDTLPRKSTNAPPRKVQPESSKDKAFPDNFKQPPKHHPNQDELATVIKAIQSGNIAIISDYIDRGLDPNTINKDADTLLHLAVRAQQNSIVDLLLRSHDINANAQNKNNETPLILAIKLGHRRLVSQIYAFTRQSIAAFDAHDSDIVVDFKSSVGAGGFGCVYKGTYKNEVVAVKTAHDGCENVLRKEISTMTKYQSPYIVNVVAVSNQTSSSPKLALQYMDCGLQYMDCGDLRQYLNAKRNGYTTSINVTPLEVAWVLANALADLHHNSTLHRDLKSQNILLSTKHYIKLGDLGISREFTHNTMTHTGTPFWEAPEVLRGERYDYAADIYSFGVILTELDTLQVPYSDLNLGLWNITQQIRDGTLRPHLSSNCEPWLKDLAEKCLSFNPQQRLTAQNVVDFLRSVQSGSYKKNGDNSDGEGPLHAAASKRRTTIATLLIEAGAFVEAKTNTGVTPLHKAAYGGHNMMIELLLKAGAHVESKIIVIGNIASIVFTLIWIVWTTAIFYAAWGGHKPTVQLLLNAGAFVRAKDKV